CGLVSLSAAKLGKGLGREFSAVEIALVEPLNPISCRDGSVISLSSTKWRRGSGRGGAQRTRGKSPQCSAFDVRRWMLDVGCWMLDVGCWMLDFRCSMFPGFMERWCFKVQGAKLRFFYPEIYF